MKNALLMTSQDLGCPEASLSAEISKYEPKETTYAAPKTMHPLTTVNNNMISTRRSQMDEQGSCMAGSIREREA